MTIATGMTVHAISSWRLPFTCGGSSGRRPARKRSDACGHEPRYDGADDGADDERLAEQGGDGERLRRMRIERGRERARAHEKRSETLTGTAPADAAVPAVCFFIGTGRPVARVIESLGVRLGEGVLADDRQLLHVVADASEFAGRGPACCWRAKAARQSLCIVVSMGMRPAAVWLDLEVGLARPAGEERAITSG